MEFLQSADFWIGLVKIVWINIILSGDNAVVIALAARSLPHQQKKAVFYSLRRRGSADLLTVVAAKLLELSFLQIVGICLLLWIGFQLLSDDGEEEGESKTYGSLMAAVRTILIADLVMSLDNDRRGGCGPGQRGAAGAGFGHQHSAGHLWQHPHDRFHGAFPHHRGAGGCPDWLVVGETIASDAILHDYAVAHPALHSCGGRTRRSAGRASASSGARDRAAPAT